MKTKIAKQATYWLGVVAIGLVVGLSIQFVTAWTEPSVSPPGGNVGAPVNTSGTGQIKSGNLTVNALGVSSAGNNSLYVANGNTMLGPGTSTQRLDINGGLRVRNLTTCSNATTGKLYADASGNVFCGTDQTGAGGGGTVTSIAAGTGLFSSPNPITATGTMSLNTAGISSCTNSTTSKIYWDSGSSRLTCGTDQAGGGGGLTGSGTTNYVSKWTGATSLGNSQIFDNGTNVGIGTASPGTKLYVAGPSGTSGAVTIDATSGTQSQLEFRIGGVQKSAVVGGQTLVGLYSFVTNSAPLVANLSSGNVGIGTLSPTQKLEVNGNVKISGLLGTQGMDPTTIKPAGWGGGITAGDVIATWSMRTNSLCLGGGGGSTNLGDCRTVWPEYITTMDLKYSANAGCSGNPPDAVCPGGYTEIYQNSGSTYWGASPNRYGCWAVATCRRN